MQLKQVFDKIEQNLEETIARIQEIIRIPSISAEEKGIECADLLVDILKKEIGFEARKIATSGPPVVYAEKMQGAETTLIFYNHYDVQPVDPLDEWISPPFEPEVREGKLFGRGASDNKGNIMARVFAIKAYQSVFGKLPLNIKFVIEGNEEVGSGSFLEFVEKHPDLTQGDFCIWEYSGRDTEGRPQVKLGVKGILYLNLEISGGKKDLHSMWGPVVKNPAWELVWLLNSLKDQNGKILIDGFYDAVRTPTQEELELLGTIPFDEEANRKDLGIMGFTESGTDLKKAFYFSPAINIDGLDSGYQGPGSKTVIPSVAKAKLDIRLVPDQDPDDIIKKLEKHLEKHQFPNSKIVALHGYPPAKTPISSKYLKIICDTGEQIYNQPIVVHPSAGGSSPMYLLIRKMDCISLGCGHAQDNIHGPNENIVIDDLILNMKHLAAIFHAFK